MIDKKIFSYWHWFFYGSGAYPGFRRLINRWFIFHVLVGTILSFLVKIKLSVCASTVLLPLAGIFIGLSFAWVQNAQALLQSDSIIELSEYHKGGFVEYVYSFQTAILSILFVLVLWGLAGLEVIDNFFQQPEKSYFYLIIKIVIFSLSSLALRECWQIVISVQWMLIVNYYLRKHIKEKSSNLNKNQ